MSNAIDLIFHADHKELDEAKESLLDLKDKIPTVGQAIEGLAKSFASIPGPVGLAVAAVAGVGLAYGEFMSKTLESINSLRELASATQSSVGDIDFLSTAITLGGGSAEKLQSAMMKLNKAIAESYDPASKSAQAFQLLGIGQDFVNTHSSAEVMQAAAEALNGFAPSANKAAVEMALFGKTGPEADEMLRQMIEGANAAKEALKGHEDQVKRLSEGSEQLNKDQGALSVAFTIFGRDLLEQVMPALIQIMDALKDASKEGGILRNMMDTLRAAAPVLVEGLKYVADAVGFLYVSFKELGITIGMVAAQAVAFASGDFKAMPEIFKAWQADMQETEDGLTRFEEKLEGTTEATKEATEAGEKHMAGMNKFAEGIAKLIDKYREEEEAAEAAYMGSTMSLEEYRKAVVEAAGAKAALAMAHAHGNAAAQEEARQMAMNAEEYKQWTADQTAGNDALLNEKEKLASMTSGQTELEKALAEIAKHPEMLQSTKDQIVQEAKLIDAKKQELELQKQMNTLNEMGSKQNAGLQGTINGLTMSTKAAKELADMTKLDLDYQKQLDATSQKTGQERIQAIIAVMDAWNKAKADQLAGQQQIDAATNDWQTGLKVGMQNWMQTTQTMNQQMQSLVGKTMDSMTTSIVDFVNTGKFNFKDFALSIVKELETMIVKQMLFNALKQGLGGTAAGSWLGIAASASANGNVFSGGSVTPFANGGVVDGPTTVPMALMGEAGPEAVMPLARGADGKLGIAGGGGGGGANLTVHNHISVQGGGTQQDQVEQARMISTMIDKRVNATLLKESLPGGKLSAGVRRY